MKTLYRYSAYLALLLFVLLIGCKGSAGMPVAPTPTAVPTPTNTPKLILQSCMRGNYAAQCGFLSVFEDRAAQSGRKINLHILVIPARTTSPAPDPIFYIQGGPGASAIENVAGAMEILGLANAQRDVVFVDQRGTGGSNQLTCPQFLDLSLQVPALKTCLANLNGDPSAYTTAWGMDDLDDVRAALGYDQINLYGGSYGTAAIQVYILRHGEHVRTAALEGASLLEVPVFERWPTSSQKALDFLFARCDNDPTCHSTFPNARKEFTETIARLEQEPATMPVNDPRTGKPMILTSQLFRTEVHILLTSTWTAVYVPKFIHLVYSQDWNGLVTLLAPVSSAGSSTPQWNLMKLTILCNEDWAKTGRAETTAASAESYLKYENVRELSVPEELCPVMPHPKPEALYGPLTRSSVPMLFINGEVDPQDPPENVADARQRYPNSLAVVAPGQGHSYVGNSCHASIVADLVTRGSVDGLSTECLEKVPLPAFEK